jgi:hypothetical protein
LSSAPPVASRWQLAQDRLPLTDRRFSLNNWRPSSPLPHPAGHRRQRCERFIQRRGQRGRGAKPQGDGKAESPERQTWGA